MKVYTYIPQTKEFGVHQRFSKYFTTLIQVIARVVMVKHMTSLVDLYHINRYRLSDFEKVATKRYSIHQIYSLNEINVCGRRVVKVK